MTNHIRLALSKENAQILLNALNGYSSEDILEIMSINEMGRELERKIARLWDENHDQNAKCICNHVYHRHFDGYEDMRAVGCKYCECMDYEGK